MIVDRVGKPGAQQVIAAGRVINGGKLCFQCLVQPFVGDAHAGPGTRQVSILAEESIDKMRSKGLKVNPGDFAENITTIDMDLAGLKVSDKLKIGEEAVLEITQFGKECHARCSIYYQAGDCVMPKEGVFARVLKGGIIKSGDKMEVIKDV